MQRCLLRHMSMACVWKVTGATASLFNCLVVRQMVASRYGTAVDESCAAGVSVMDKDRLWYKAVSFGDVPHGFQQPRRMGFCHWALLAPNPEVTIVPDMTKDAR